MSHDGHPHLKRINIMDVLQNPLEKNHVNHSACISNACQDEHPLVSVVIPTFNRSAALSLAIASVQNQTFRSLEILVIDDGSTDDTESCIQRLKAADSRIRYFRMEKNKGAQAARNIGIKNAVNILHIIGGHLSGSGARNPLSGE